MWSCHRPVLICKTNTGVFMRDSFSNVTTASSYLDGKIISVDYFCPLIDHSSLAH